MDKQIQTAIKAIVKEIASKAAKEAALAALRGEI